MAKVIIELQANTQAAIAQIKAFAKAQQDTFDVIRAGNPVLEASTIRVSKLTDAAGGSTKGFNALNYEAKALARGGLQDLISGVPIVGNSLASLANQLGGLPLLIGGVVGAGAVLLKYFQSLDESGQKTVGTIQALGESMAASTKETNLKVEAIRAKSQGDEATRLRLAADLAIQESERVRDKRIQVAEQELQARDIFGRQTTKLSVTAMAEVAAAEKAHLDNRRVLQAQFQADSKKLEDDRKKASLEWLDKEIARLQEADAAAQTFARAKTAAAFETQLGGAERGGDPVAVARVRYAQQTEALKQALDDQVQLQAAKLNKGEILDREFEARKRELIEVSAARQAALSEQFVANEQKAFASVDSALRELLGRLGPGFEDLSEKLDISAEVDASRQSFQTIQTAFESGRLSASQAAEAVRRVTEDLLAQGAKLDEIAVVVPQQLQSMSGLFRGMSTEIQGTTKQIGGVQTAMNQLNPSPIATLTAGWYGATYAAEAYKQKVLEIARIGLVTPREGMLTPGTQSTTVVLPQEGGMAAEDRRTLAELLTDDERRGLLD